MMVAAEATDAEAAVAAMVAAEAVVVVAETSAADLAARR